MRVRGPTLRYDGDITLLGYCKSGFPAKMYVSLYFNIVKGYMNSV